MSFFSRFYRIYRPPKSTLNLLSKPIIFTVSFVTLTVSVCSVYRFNERQKVQKLSRSFDLQEWIESFRQPNQESNLFQDLKKIIKVNWENTSSTQKLTVF